MKIIIPCAGRSSRFPNMRPKWMLNDPNGNLMVHEALKGLTYKNNEIIITMLKEHEEKYNILDGLKSIFGSDITVCILDSQTNSQPETVYETIKKLNITEPVFIKDSDNYFEIDSIYEDFNYITVEDLNNFDEINPRNKSYVIADENRIVYEIYEKQIVSNLFSIGGYYFKDPSQFCYAYNSIIEKTNYKEIYVSDIIGFLIKQKEIFFYKRAKNYKDWGTIKEWNKYKTKLKTYFIDIDGVIFKNSAQFFKPKWGETAPLYNNVETINKLKRLGNQIILVTSRTESFRKITEESLKDINLSYDGLIMGCYHTQRVLINDFSASNSFPSCIAINIQRDKDNLSDYLEQIVE